MFIDFFLALFPIDVSPVFGISFFIAFPFAVWYFPRFLELPYWVSIILGVIPWYTASWIPPFAWIAVAFSAILLCSFGYRQLNIVLNPQLKVREKLIQIKRYYKTFDFDEATQPLERYEIHSKTYQSKVSSLIDDIKKHHKDPAVFILMGQYDFAVSHILSSLQEHKKSNKLIGQEILRTSHETFVDIQNELNKIINHNHQINVKISKEKAAEFKEKMDLERKILTNYKIIPDSESN